MKIHLVLVAGVSTLTRKPSKSEQNEEFNKRLSELIRKRGVTVLSLSKETKIPKSTLQDWTTNTVPTDFKAAARLAKALGVSLSFLLTGEDEHAPEDLTNLYERDTVLIDGLAEIRIVRVIPKTTK